MKWTKEPPTKPGWYWVKGKYDRWPIEISRNRNGDLSVNCNEGDYSIPEYKSMRRIELWSGPIPEPEEVPSE